MNEATQGLSILLSLIAIAAIIGFVVVVWILIQPEKSASDQAGADAKELLAKANAEQQKPTRTRERVIS